MNYTPIRHFSYCVVPYNFSYSYVMIWINHALQYVQIISLWINQFYFLLWKLFGKLYSTSVLSILTPQSFPVKGFWPWSEILALGRCTCSPPPSLCRSQNCVPLNCYVTSALLLTAVLYCIVANLLLYRNCKK